MRAQGAAARRRTSSPALHGTAALASATAPAKINLVLEVAGRRPDGFHELRSVFAPLALADTLTVGFA